VPKVEPGSYWLYISNKAGSSPIDVPFQINWHRKTKGNCWGRVLWNYSGRKDTGLGVTPQPFFLYLKSIFHLVIENLCGHAYRKTCRCYPHPEPFNIPTKEPLPFSQEINMLLYLRDEEREEIKKSSFRHWMTYAFKQLLSDSAIVCYLKWIDLYWSHKNIFLCTGRETISEEYLGGIEWMAAVAQTTFDRNTQAACRKNFSWFVTSSIPWCDPASSRVLLDYGWQAEVCPWPVPRMVGFWRKLLCCQSAHNVIT
jgi:hypothetical protein